MATAGRQARVVELPVAATFGRAAYIADMQVAQQDWDNNLIRLLRSRLDRQQPRSTGNIDLRDFDMGDYGGSHLFTYDIEGAAFQRVQDDDWRTTSWTVTGGMRERSRSGPLGESVDL